MTVVMEFHPRAFSCLPAPYVVMYDHDADTYRWYVMDTETGVLTELSTPSVS